MYKFKLENMYSGVPITTRITTQPNLQGANFPQKQKQPINNPLC